MPIKKQRLVTEIAAELTTELTAEIATEITAGLGYYSQIQLIMPVVQARQGLEKMSWRLSWPGLRISGGTQELPGKL